MTKITVHFKDGKITESEIDGDNVNTWPVAVTISGENYGSNYPIWEGKSHSNLYARVMTLVEAVIENPARQKAVKDLFAKELQAFALLMERKGSPDYHLANGSPLEEV